LAGGQDRYAIQFDTAADARIAQQDNAPGSPPC
jgi:hypothetical protein